MNQELSIALFGVAATFVTALGGFLFNIGQFLKIRQEMKNNHGSSLRDAVDRIEASQKTMKEDLDLIQHNLVVVSSTSAVEHAAIREEMREHLAELKQAVAANRADIDQIMEEGGQT